MKKPPFKIKPSTRAVLMCDGKFVIGGRTSFVWETFLMRRAAGVPGEYAMRGGDRGEPFHRVAATIEEAEIELALCNGLPRHGARQVERMRETRAARERRGLPVG